LKNKPSKKINIMQAGNELDLLFCFLFELGNEGSKFLAQNARYLSMGYTESCMRIEIVSYLLRRTCWWSIRTIKSIKPMKRASVVAGPW
jgi:hypothetical protein